VQSPEIRNQMPERVRPRASRSAIGSRPSSTTRAGTSDALDRGIQSPIAGSSKGGIPNRTGRSPSNANIRHARTIDVSQRGERIQTCPMSPDPWTSEETARLSDGQTKVVHSSGSHGVERLQSPWRPTPISERVQPRASRSAIGSRPASRTAGAVEGGAPQSPLVRSRTGVRRSGTGRSPSQSKMRHARTWIPPSAESGFGSVPSKGDGEPGSSSALRRLGGQILGSVKASVLGSRMGSQPHVLTDSPGDFSDADITAHNQSGIDVAVVGTSLTELSCLKEVVRILKFLRISDIVNFHLISSTCHQLCRPLPDRKLLVPVFSFQRSHVAQVHLSGVDVLFADNIRAIGTRDNENFFAAATACTGLMHFFCADNPRLEVSVLARFLASAQRLRTLDLARSCLARKGECLDGFFRALPPSLQLLDLSHNKLEDSHILQLAEALCAPRHRRVEALILRSNFLGNGAALGLADYLCRSAGASLQSLDLRTNVVDSVGACALLRAAIGHSSLYDLRLGYNASNTQEDPATATKAADVLLGRIGTQLERLDLSNVHVGDQGACSIGRALVANTTLRRLELAFNSVGRAGAQALASGLSDNTTLTVVDLRDNHIGDGGAEALARVLIWNPLRRMLLLARNDISDKGAKILAAAVKETECRAVVDLTGNVVSAEVRRNLDARDFLKEFEWRKKTGLS